MGTGYKLEMTRRPLGLILDVLHINESQAFSVVKDGFDKMTEYLSRVCRNY